MTWARQDTKEARLNQEDSRANGFCTMKYILSGKVEYDSRRPQEWLQSLRDYVAGRTAKLDPLLDWVELQSEEIPMDDIGLRQGSAPMVDAAKDLREVSRQFLALLGPLLAKDGSQAGMFANVPRHNGLEAWRRLAEPINEDIVIMRKELLPLVTNPKAATSMDKIEEAIQVWDTNIRLFTAEEVKHPPTRLNASPS